MNKDIYACHYILILDGHSNISKYVRNSDGKKKQTAYTWNMSRRHRMITFLTHEAGS